jgi:putative oxidoreductase
MMYINKKLNTCAHIYNFFLKIGSNLQSIFLLFMRITWGHQFFITGRGKLHNIDHVTQFFTSLNIPYPEFSAYLVGFCEMIGGICLMLGFASRIITIPLLIIMFTAVSTAHIHIIRDSLFIIDPHAFVRQTPYPYLITSLLVFLFGPGRISIDAWIKRWVDNQPKY